MSVKGPKIANRQPNVVLIVEDVDEFIGVTSIIKTQFSEYRVILENEDTVEILTAAKPPVILFGLATVEKCIEYYSALVEAGELDYPHYSVLLCNNKESLVSFRCCMKGIFDNYFVYLPLFEKFRLLMIVQAGLLACQTKSNIKEFNEDLFKSIDDELSQQIDEASACKQNLLAKINESRESIKKLNEDIQQQPAVQSAPAQEVVATLTAEHVNPLLSSLEEGICSSLEQIISQLVAKQITQQTKGIQAIASLDAATSSQAVSEEFAFSDQTTPEEIAFSDKTPPEEAIFSDETIPEEVAFSDQSMPEEFAFSDETIIEEVVTNIEPIKSHKKNILVAEDNPLYKDMLLSILIGEGYNVDAAEDGLVALQKIKEKTYDLILMDLFMPKLDGLNVTKKVRDISGGNDIPVIALTGNKNKELIRKWASYGLKGYIIKPSSRESIISSVAKVFET